MLVLPNQSRGALDRYGITREEARRSAWAIDRDGRRREGADAVNAVLRELGGWPAMLSRIMQTPPAASVARPAYRWFARHRRWFSRLGVRPECEETSAGCY